MEAYPVSVLVSVAAVHLRPWALMSRVCQVSSFCADTDGPTLADLESGRSFGSHFGSQTARPAPHGNGLTRARSNYGQVAATRLSDQLTDYGLPCR
jgi:hypothetical protein